MAERSSAAIYTIGMFTGNDPDANPRVLKRLAEATGGESFFPKQSGELAAIGDYLADDIRNRYTIGYVSTNVKPDGVHRSIRLIATTPGSGAKLRVRTRRGYIAHQGAVR